MSDLYQLNLSNFMYKCNAYILHSWKFFWKLHGIHDYGTRQEVSEFFVMSVLEQNMAIIVATCKLLNLSTIFMSYQQLFVELLSRELHMNCILMFLDKYVLCFFLLDTVIYLVTLQINKYVNAHIRSQVNSSGSCENSRIAHDFARAQLPRQKR